MALKPAFDEIEFQRERFPDLKLLFYVPLSVDSSA